MPSGMTARQGQQQNYEQTVCRHASACTWLMRHL